MIGFALGDTDRPLSGRVTFSGLPPEMADINVRIERANGAFRFIGLPKQNPRQKQQAFQDELARLADTGSWQGYRFGMTVYGGYRERAAQVGWLRVAYLVAFAALGYGYIFRRQLRVVRWQLAAPEAEVLTYFSTTTATAEMTTRQLLLVEGPARWRSLTVQVGRHTVFLPHPDDRDAEIYQRLKEDGSRGGALKLDVSGKIIPWPTQLVMGFDLPLSESAMPS